MKRTTISKFMVTAFFAVVFFSIGGVQDATAETAADNYSLYCVQCHGTAGVGKGINAPFLAVAPRNHKSAKDMSALKDETVALAIADGGVAVGKSTQMPSWKRVLTPAEIKDMVKYLRKMCKCEGKK